MTLKAPFPWFGGKSRVAPEVWSRFGRVANYVEPFAGSLAVLLGRPDEPSTETVNDIDGYIANTWRAIAHDPEAVAYYADWPVNENDLNARHSWLVRNREDFVPRLEGDPDFYDAKVAGWWLAGIAGWIGSGWCAGTGPWTVEDGKLALGNKGQGVNRQLPHLGKGRGVNRKHEGLYAYMDALSARLRNVRVCCGDFERVMGPTPTTGHGITAVFLDPPYMDGRTEDVYAHDDTEVAVRAREWAITNSDNPLLRIALCGYAGEHDWQMAEAGYTAHRWKAHGGYGVGRGGRGGANSHAEVVWFSPHCLDTKQGGLF